MGAVGKHRRGPRPGAAKDARRQRVRREEFRIRKEEFRIDALTELERQLNKVVLHAREYIGSPEVLSRSGIKVRPLRLGTQGDTSLSTKHSKYFRKFPTKPRKSPHAWRPRPYPPSDGHLDISPSFVADQICEQFTETQRDGYCANSGYKMKWIHCPVKTSGIFSSKYHEMVPEEYNGIWSLKSSWRAERVPHVLLLLVHAGGKGNKILYGELSTILMAMTSRYSLNSLRENTVIPVTAISVVKDKVRILQAHWDGEDTIIRVSRLYKPDSDSNTGQLISEYLAIQPDGDTKCMP